MLLHEQELDRYESFNNAQHLIARYTEVKRRIWEREEAPPAPKPAAPQPPATVQPVAATPKPAAEAPKPAPEAQKPVVEAPKPAPVASAPKSRTKFTQRRFEDARHCLEKSTNTEVIKCAEAYL